MIRGGAVPGFWLRGGIKMLSLPIGPVISQSLVKATGAVQQVFNMQISEFGLIRPFWAPNYGTHPQLTVSAIGVLGSRYV